MRACGAFAVFRMVACCFRLCSVGQRAEDVSRLQERIKPYLLRRMKEDVEKAVPPKEETIIEASVSYSNYRHAMK